MLKYALLGFGGLGKLHFKNLLKIEEERKDISLVAICGADRKTISENSKINLGVTSLEGVDFGKYNFYDTLDELFENEKIDFAISALPTVMHKETAVKMLDKGIHVFSEKPMALSYDDCNAMTDAAERNNKILMIGQCLRFNDAYQKVKEYIDKKTYGKVVRADFSRLSCLPTWTFNNWILDRKQSGGCPIDMHIHDVDLVNYFFGMPKSVSSRATHNRAEFESIFTRYEYEDKLVSASADWGLPQKLPFEANTFISFENACVKVTGGKLTVYTDDEVITPEYDKQDEYYKEICEFISCVVTNRKSEISNCESVKKSMKIVEKEIESAENNGMITLL